MPSAHHLPYHSEPSKHYGAVLLKTILRYVLHAVMSKAFFKLQTAALALGGADADADPAAQAGQAGQGQGRRRLLHQQAQGASAARVLQVMLRGSLS